MITNTTFDTTFSAILAAEERAHQKYEAETVVAPDGRTIADLRRAFEYVQDPENWKMPIAKRCFNISDDERTTISNAIEFFTGSKPTWTPGGRAWIVRADGYYAATGA